MFCFVDCEGKVPILSGVGRFCSDACYQNSMRIFKKNLEIRSSLRSQSLLGEPVDPTVTFSTNSSQPSLNSSAWRKKVKLTLQMHLKHAMLILTSSPSFVQASLKPAEKRRQRERERDT